MDKYRKVLTKKYYFDVYTRAKGDEQTFKDIVYGETEADRRKGLNVYKKK